VEIIGLLFPRALSMMWIAGDWLICNASELLTALQTAGLPGGGCVLQQLLHVPQLSQLGLAVMAGPKQPSMAAEQNVERQMPDRYCASCCKVCCQLLLKKPGMA
jgi:hypothetical protein